MLEMNSIENEEIAMDDQTVHQYETICTDGISQNNLNKIETTKRSLLTNSCCFKTTFVLVCVLLGIAIGMAVKTGIVEHSKGTDSLQPGFDMIRKLLAQQLICGDGWTFLLNHCYYFGESKLSWDESEAECLKMDSNLLKIASQAEQDIIVATIRSSGKINRNYWIGLNDRRKENDSVWISDNSRPSFTASYPGQPDNKKGIQHCVCLWESTEWKWIDTKCSIELYFICKRPGLPTLANNRFNLQEKKFKEISQLKCSEMNASLVTIQSEEENEILADFLRQEGPLALSVYIGLRKSATGLFHREFVWTDNKTVTFSDWMQGEPSIKNGHGTIEECVEMKLEFGYLWNDVPCHFKNYFLCEKIPR